MNPIKFVVDLYLFFAEVFKASHTDDYQFTANENWWMTKSVIAHQQETGFKATSACTFFWTAMLGRPLYRLVKFTGNGNGEKGFIILMAIFFIVFGTLTTWSLIGFLLSLLISIFWLVMITWTIHATKREMAQNKPREAHVQTTLSQDFDNWRSALGQAPWWLKPLILIRGLLKGAMLAIVLAIVAPIWFLVLLPLGWLFNLLKNNYCPMVAYPSNE